MTTPADVPVVDDETRPWWDALREERLLVRRCAGCGRAHLYPRPFCPYCWSEAVSWEDAVGDGRLYTWSVVHANALPPFRDRVPYVAAIVELAEGPRLPTTVDADPEQLRVDMPVKVTFRHDGPVSLAVFRPA